MTAEFEGLVLEHLRAIRADISDIKDRVSRAERRLSTIEGTLDGALSDSDHDTGQWFVRHLEHINGVRR